MKSALARFKQMFRYPFQTRMTGPFFEKTALAFDCI
jgi:hypothetical protein